MKALLTLSLVFVALSLSACGDKHQTYAVDAVEQAQANAIANAPKAETIKFDDEGSATATPATATTEATAPADTTASAEATAEQPANTATATAEATTKQ